MSKFNTVYNSTKRPEGKLSSIYETRFTFVFAMKSNDMACEDGSKFRSELALTFVEHPICSPRASLKYFFNRTLSQHAVIISRSSLIHLPLALIFPNGANRAILSPFYHSQPRSPF